MVRRRSSGRSRSTIGSSDMAERPRYETPAVTRSLLVLAMAEGLVADRQWPYQQAQVRLQGQIEPDVWDVVLYGSDGVRPIWQVARQEVQVAIINPGQLLALAARGSPPFDEPLSLRTITVIPSVDQLGIAVGAHTGIT